MNKTIALKQNKLILESIIFTEVVKKLCKNLVDENLLFIKKNLEECVSDLPKLMKKYLDSEDRVARIRHLVQIQGLVDECNEYLEIIARTRQGDISPVLKELTKFTKNFEAVNRTFIH
jgi:hypothetical protein